MMKQFKNEIVLYLVAIKINLHHLLLEYYQMVINKYMIDLKFYSNLKVFIQIGQLGQHVDHQIVYQYVHVNVYRNHALII